MGLTEQQKAAVQAKGSVAVIAGAGTGKTHMLAERYLYHLESGDSPLAVVALTFTEKAAAELRSRIRQTIQNRFPNPDCLAELEAAQISTFHALAARICREHPQAARVPPDFTVLDDVEGKVWLAEALREALGQIPLSLYESVPYSLMRTILKALLSDPLMAQRALEKTHKDWLSEVQTLREEAWDAFVSSEVWRAANAILPRCTAPGDKLNDVRESALAAMARIEQGNDIVASLAVLGGLKINCGSQNRWGGPGPFATVKETIRALRDLAQSTQKAGLVTLELNNWDEQTEAILPVLRAAFEQVLLRVSNTKARQRVLDFNDLEVHALNALQHPEVRDYYAQRWRAFLIDEFQDTNPVQGRLLEQLTAHQQLTIVGDVKQSIYGFRRADVNVFQAWCNRIHSVDDPPKELNLSFRTHHSLVQSINTIFEPILNELHQNLAANRQADPHPGPHLRVLTVQQPQGATSDQCRRVEAQQIADRVKQMLDDQVQVHDKTTGALRPVENRDIAILARTWAPLELYAQVLENRGIPILQAGGGNLLETREAQDAWALLRFLADPSDDLALVAVLRSPFFALSDRLLFGLAQTLPERVSWWQHLKSQPMTELRPVLEVLERLLVERRTEPPTRLLQWADRLSGYTAVIGNLPNALRRSADWRGFVDFVRQLEQGASDGLSVVRRLQLLAAHGVEVPRPALEAGDAVSLMTIHAAKGLEWPVVVVADLARRSAADLSPVRFDPDLGFALKVEDENGDLQKSALYTLLEYRQRQADRAEVKRVLYVALTRARDHLILTAADDHGGSLDVLKAGLKGCLSIEEILFESDRLQPIEVEDPPLPSQPSRILVHPAGSGLWELPVTALTEYAQCPKRFSHRYVEGHPGFREGKGRHGTEIGTLTHAALQHRIQDIQGLTAMAPTLPLPIIQEALDLAQRFHRLEIYRPYRSQIGIAEQPMRLSLGTLTFTSLIDWVTSEFVLDFKTDQEQNPHHHRLQLWAYAKASGRSTAHIAYLRHNQIHTFTAEDLRSFQVEAEAMAQAIATGDYSPQPSPQACGSCSYLELCESGVRPS